MTVYAYTSFIGSVTCRTDPDCKSSPYPIAILEAVVVLLVRLPTDRTFALVGADNIQAYLDGLQK